MNHRALVLAAALLSLSSNPVNALESMEEMTKRVFDLAQIQLKYIDSQLGPGQAPRTLEADGSLCTSDVRWWCSGFYPGSLWLTYEYTGDEQIKALAQKHTLALEPLLEMHTDHDIGFQTVCSYGQALRITGDEGLYRDFILKAADKLAARFIPKAGIIRSWDGEWTVRRGWDIPVIIDNMMNLQLLLDARRMGADRHLEEVAKAHANSTIQHHFRSDYSCFHLVDYSSADGSVIARKTHQGHSDDSSWARGQAWALYGYTMMYVKTGDEQYFRQADYISKYIIRNLPADGIPWWDFSCAGDLKDASAAAVMASAFVQLYEITGRRHFLEVADRQLRTLAGEEYLAPELTNGGFLLRHSVGNKPGASEIDVPLTYADYYFLEALLRRQRATAHPRLFLDKTTWDGICRQLEDGSNKALTLIHERIMREAGTFPSDSIVWELDESGTRILAQSKKGLRRILCDAYAYRYSSDPRFLEHAERTISQICDMPDWNAWHFLDVAEMSAALAIGYDWLYDDLPADLKERMVRAVTEFSFVEATDQNKAWFYEKTHNWNQVCNGGLTLAALSLREDCGALAGNIVRNAVRTNRKALASIYAPDGCYPEGVSYWNYGNTYQILLNGALDSALGDDFGLSLAEGFDRTADYVCACHGCGQKMFNYSDNSLIESPSVPLWYYAWRFRKPELLCSEMTFLERGDSYYSDILPVITAYASRLNPEGAGPAADGMYVGHGDNPIATLKGPGWYLGVKGGKASNNHGHADAGSFVFDRDSVRWASDPGKVLYTEAENLLKSRGGNFWDRGQESLRWTIFPIGNEWHNTLTVNGKLHRVDRKAEIVSASDSTITIDFAGVLGDDISSARRTFTLEEGAALTITDHIKAATDSHVCFTLMTEARPSLDGARLTLRSGLKAMTVTTSGAKASISTSESPDGNLAVVRIEYDIRAGRSCSFRTRIE